MITNRTQADVDAVDLSSTKASKGAYNYVDLNRVESKVAELSTWLNNINYLSEPLVTKTDWLMSDIFKQSDGVRYLNNVRTIRNAVTIYQNTPQVPTSMDKLTYSGANDIEKILADKESQLYGMSNWYVYGGVANGGQNRLWQHRFRDYYKPVYNTTWNSIVQNYYEVWDDFNSNDTWISVV